MFWKLGASNSFWINLLIFVKAVSRELITLITVVVNKDWKCSDPVQDTRRESNCCNRWSLDGAFRPTGTTWWLGISVSDRVPVHVPMIADIPCAAVLGCARVWKPIRRIEQKPLAGELYCSLLQERGIKDTNCDLCSLVKELLSAWIMNEILRFQI